MGNDYDEMIPPDDPRFEGAQFISDNAMKKYIVDRSGFLVGAHWRWETWRERPAVAVGNSVIPLDPHRIDVDASSGAPAVWDHDHCEFCYEAAFSERYPDDLREGWTTTGQIWLCNDCFTEYRDRFRWTWAEPWMNNGD